MTRLSKHYCPVAVHPVRDKLDGCQDQEVGSLKLRASTRFGIA